MANCKQFSAPFWPHLLICPYAISHVSSLRKCLLKCFAYYYYFKSRVVDFKIYACSVHDYK